MSLPRKKMELSPRLKMGVGRGRSGNKALRTGAFLCLLTAVILTANAIRLVWTNNSTNTENILSSATPQVLGATDIQGEPTTATPEIVEYKVVKGDTLFNVSQKFNISWTTVATLNNLKSPFVLKPGQTIKIPR